MLRSIRLTNHSRSGGTLRRPRGVADTYALVMGRRSAAVLLSLVSLTVAQTNQATPDDAPFTRYVPASAGCFVSVENLGRWDDTLPQLGVSAAMALAEETGGVRRFSGDWRAALVGMIGDSLAIDLASLTTLRAGVAADSCGDLSRSVWFFHLPDPSVLDQWFPTKVRKAQGRSELATMFRTSDGLIVALRDDVLLLSRRWVGDGLLVSSMQMMTGKSLPSLQEAKPYRELATYLPGHALGTIFFVPKRREGATTSMSTVLRPVFDGVIVGVYDVSGRVDVAIRGSLRDELVQSPVAADGLGQLLRLPRSTLMAAVGTTSIDLNALGTSGSGELSRYAKLLMTLRGARADSHETLPTLGPHVVWVWGQDLTSPSDFPHVTLLAECDDAAMAKSELDSLLTSVLSAVRTLGPDAAANSLTINRETHLGVSVSYVPPLAPEMADRFGTLGLLADVEPAWAAWGDWLVVSTHRIHLKSILDAQFGMAPTLGFLPLIRTAWHPDRRASAVMVMRGRAASRQIDAWLATRSSPPPLWLDPLWWSSVLAGELTRGASLGLRFAEPTLPGQITIASVESGTLSDGRLLVGDQILGLNGRLLSLFDADQDFRLRWRQRSEKQAPVLRVIRAGVPMDVELPRTAHAGADVKRFDPSQVLRLIGEAGRDIGFASYSVQPSDAHHYAALLTLHRSKPRPMP